MSEVKIGEFSGQPLVAGACTLCGNEGTGNMGLFLCKSHIAVIIKEHGEGLNKRWHKEFRATLLSTIRERVEGISELPENHCHHSIGMSSCDYCDGLSDGVDKFLSLLTEIEGEMK